MLSHNKVPVDIFDGKRILDIGCGRNKLKGAIGLDQMPYEGVDIASISKARYRSLTQTLT